MKHSLSNVSRWLWHTLLHAALYTVVTTFVFLIAFSFAGWLNEPAVTLGGFLKIFLVALVVSVSAVFFQIKRLPKFIAYILNYFVILLGFFLVFATSEALNLSGNVGKIFIYVILITVIYVLIATALYFAKRLTARHTKRDGRANAHSKEVTKGSDDYESIL